MKKLFVLCAIATLAACGGSDNKPAGDPSTTNTTATPSATTTSTPMPATTGTAPASTSMPSTTTPSK